MRWSLQKRTVAVCLLAAIPQLLLAMAPSIVADHEARVEHLVAEPLQAVVAGNPIEPSRTLPTTPSRCIGPGCEHWFDPAPDRFGYVWRLIAIFLIVLGEGLLVTMLFVQLRRRRVAERELQNHLIDASHSSRLTIAGELAASIAHEIKQPLAAILSNTETAESLLKSDGNLRDSLPPILADIRRDDLRATEVIRRLRSLLARHEVEHQPMNLNAVVADACALLHGEAERRGVRIEIRQDSVARILGDCIQIQQVLMNLIMNAMDAVEDVSDERRTIIVSVTDFAQCPTIQVRDMGHGIRANELPKVFQSFYSSKRTGMGLGLSIARTIVDAHGGFIEATSRFGEGSEFRVSFPPLQSIAQTLRIAGAS